MFWYILNTLSRFTLSLETVEKIVLKRFQNYHSTHDSETEGGDFEAGHSELAHVFLLLVAADCCAVAETVVGGECRVFMREFSRKNCDEKGEELSRLVTDLNYLSQREEVKKLSAQRENRLKWALNSAEKLSQICCHVFDEFHPRTCEEVVIRLPFTFLLESVARRKVTVRNGEITAVCGDSQQILAAVYRVFVELELDLLKDCEPLRAVVYHSEDDRLRQLIRRLTNLFTGRITPESALGSVRACDVDRLVQYFPPCMANLHQILRKKHRLSYESRYQYTLFLKDIGMPVNENILFWETEYKKPFCGSSCTHDWTEKQYRYKYQIEHMYGLIGSRDAKTSYSCSKFTGGLLSKMDGGCPFRHMTAENLRNSIPAKMMQVADVEDIFKYRERDMPQSACSVYLSCQRSLFVKRRRERFNGENPPGRTCLSHVISPLQYFNMARSMTQD